MNTLPEQFGFLVDYLQNVWLVTMQEALELGSYGVAHRELMASVEHRRSRYLNNRAENSHQPTRQREQDSRHGGCVRIVASRLSCGFPGWSRFGPRHDAKKLTKALCTEFAGTRCNPGGRATAAASNGPDGRAPINALCLES